MNGNRLLQQVLAIFSLFMVFFYTGLGVYIVFFFDMSYLRKEVLVIFGSAMILYGVFRAVRAYNKIVEVFFTKDEKQE